MMVLQLLLNLQDAPLLATTLIPPGEVEPLNDPEIIRERFEHQLEGVIDAGACALEATTVVDLTTMGNGDAPTLIRKGLGPLSGLGL
jgi:tRNA A37 threonylcarbamoyladenosine synthetase subunit TsaC/SUA5/YrdC